MAIVALHLTQRLTGLMVSKNLISHEELKAIYDELGKQFAVDPSGAGAVHFLRAVTPTAISA